MVDRRRFLLITQAWMVAAAGALGIFTLLGMVTPWLLLAFTFMLGLGAVMNDPAWQAITPEIVCAENHAPAVALNSVGFNVARCRWPGIRRSRDRGDQFRRCFSAERGFVFWRDFLSVSLEAASFEHGASTRMMESLRAGLQYVKGDHVGPLRSDSDRRIQPSRKFTAGVAAGDCSRARCDRVRSAARRVWTGSALAGAGCASRRCATGIPWTVSSPGAIVLFALTDLRLGTGALVVTGSCWCCLRRGIAWIAILACLNVAAQTMSPPWMRARALSMYLLVLQGGMAIGSAAWGALATKPVFPLQCFVPQLHCFWDLLTVRRYRLTARELEFTPAVVPGLILQD